MDLLLGLLGLWRWVETFLGAYREEGDRFDLDALPDCMVETILLELPVDQVLRCRAVCRRWKHLIDDRGFAPLAADPGKPPSVTVFQCVRPYITRMEGLYLIRSRPNNKRLTEGGIKRMPLRSRDFEAANPPVIRGSCDGFIIFGGLSLPTRYLICNPVTRESVRLGEKIAETVCAFYFHPSREEYRLLCTGRRANDQFGYYTCDLRGESRNELGLYPDGPREEQGPAPIIFRSSLYTMMGIGYHCIILALDLDTEELQFMRPPTPVTTPSQYIFEAEGRLCFFYWWFAGLEIWSLQDRASCSWIKRFCIEVEYTYVFESYALQVLPLAINGHELILNWDGWWLVRCDLRTGVVSKIIKLKEEKGLACFPVATCSLSLFPLSRLCL